ncbi:M61 family metallopeptidase [Marinicella rhabdoformis]|uniref:M61 family metallopeptidase n=1 Tax=Marinicella rhabdoformis TaxID=2580566 RepID=UPI0012AEC8DA|nr:PDZ domain-containing protein [Marinicella rhabdoformis]
MKYILTIFFAFLINTTTHAQATETQATTYKFTVTDAAHHLAEVTVTFPNVTEKVLTVKLPVWRSGRYEILDLGKNLRDMSAKQNGESLSVTQMDKNTWKVFLKSPGAVTLNYEVYANMLRHRVAHIDDSHAFIDASGVFIYAPKFRDQDLTVSMNVPENWASRSGMEQVNDHKFKANNYDQLVDSPIESGIHEYVSFDVNDKKYGILIWGEGNHDINDIQEKAKLLHHEAEKVWGDFPFDEYLYMIHAGPGLRGATEHVNSTIMQFDRFGFDDKKTYNRFLATTAHEFIHTWNVKAYRPSGIAPYDYDKENYSDLFWMAEGTTSYYDDLFMFRAGIYSQKDYFSKLSEDLTKHLTKPGRNHRSLSESSFNTWQKENSQRNHNANVNIYLEGALTTWFLDYQIRLATDNNKSMDDVQAELFKKHRNSDKGYDKSDVLAILKSLTSKDFSSLWQAHIDGTQALPFAEMLDFYGLTIKEEKAEDIKQWIGFTLNNDTIGLVDKNSPAWDAGLTTGDELIALNGLRMTTKDWESHSKKAKAGDHWQITYARAGKMQQTELTIKETQKTKITLTALKKPNKKQKQRFKSWTSNKLESPK